MTANPLLAALNIAIPEARQKMAQEKEKRKLEDIGANMKSIFKDDSLNPIQKSESMASLFASKGMLKESVAFNEKAMQMQVNVDKMDRDIEKADENNIFKLINTLVPKVKNTKQLEGLISSLKPENRTKLLSLMGDGIELGRTKDGAVVRTTWFADKSDPNREYAYWADPNSEMLRPMKVGGEHQYRYKTEAVQSALEKAGGKAGIALGKEKEGRKQKTIEGTLEDFLAQRKGDNAARKNNMLGAVQVKNMLLTGKEAPATWGALKSLLARTIAQEKGVLTEQDVARVSGRQSVPAKLMRLFSEKATSQSLNPDDIKDFVNFIDTGIRVNQSILSSQAQSFAESRESAYEIKFDDTMKILEPELALPKGFSYGFEKYDVTQDTYTPETEQPPEQEQLFVVGRSKDGKSVKLSNGDVISIEDAKKRQIPIKAGK